MPRHILKLNQDKYFSPDKGHNLFYQDILIATVDIRNTIISIKIHNTVTCFRLNVTLEYCNYSDYQAQIYEYDVEKGTEITGQFTYISSIKATLKPKS